MVTSILILLFLPLCKRVVKDPTFAGFSEAVKHLFFYMFTISIIMLGFVGGLPAEFPYIQYGKIFTVIYFSSFFINFVFSNIENAHSRMVHSQRYLDEIIKS